MKARLDDLAVLGGTPEFQGGLHVGRPNIGDTERVQQRIGELLSRRWLTNGGPFVEAFEQRVAAFVGARHCIATCNATVALEIAIRALDLRGEVIIPSFTFIATAHALQWQGIVPVFCDVDPETHTIDPRRIEALITPRTTGVIGVHLWGRPCDVEAIGDLARRHGLTVLFDAAHAFGCSHGGRMVGRFGAAEVFSFHATKVVNAFEGGAVVTDDNALAGRIRLMKNFGFLDYDRVVHVGTNGKMSEASAAMGLTSLESFDAFVEANRQNYQAYRQGLAGLRGIRLIEFDDTERCTFHYVVLDVDEAAAGIGRDQIQAVLWAEHVLARRYFFPGCHRMEPYESSFPDAGLRLPNTERLAARVLCLPTGTAVSADEAARVCGIIRLSVDNARDLVARMAGVASPIPPD